MTSNLTRPSFVAPQTTSIHSTSSNRNTTPSYMAGTFPSEVWADVLFYAAGPGGEREGMTDKERAQLRDTRLVVIQVCRGWKVSWISFYLGSSVWKRLSRLAAGSDGKAILQGREGSVPSSSLAREARTWFPSHRKVQIFSRSAPK